MHSTSAFKPPSASRTTRDETVHFPIYGYNSKEAVWATPQQPGLIEPNKPSEKKRGGLSIDEPDASQRFDRCSRFDWHSFPPGVHARLAPMFAWCSYFAWRPFSPVSHFAWCLRFEWHSYQHDAHVSLDAHVHLMAAFRLTLMLAWYSCFTRYSRETAATHTVHGPRELPHGKNRAACMISRLPT